MTKMKMFALALGVWGAGGIAATALAYDLSRTPTPRGPAVDTTSIHVDAPEVVRHAREERPVLAIPPITIVGHRVARPLGVTAPQKTESLPQVSRMHCADWRDLQMGSGRVQTCE
jgi:hypothetical protein